MVSGPSPSPSQLTSGKRTPFGVRRQLRLLTPVLITWTGAAVAMAVAGRQNVTPLRQLFLDAAYLGRQPWYTGILSDAGLISWSIAMTAAAMGSWIAHRTGRRGAARFLAGGAVVVGVMLIDVWIQFHSAVAPKIGIPSNIAQVLIAGLGIAWLIGFRAEIMRTRWLILLFSYGFLGASAGIDTFWDPHGDLGLWLEDGTRLVGIVTLTHYLVVTTMDILRSVLKQNASAARNAQNAPRVTAQNSLASAPSVLPAPRSGEASPAIAQDPSSRSPG